MDLKKLFEEKESIVREIVTGRKKVMEFSRTTELF
jgi:hypothetical protein